jgi:hypothetical protein
MRRQLHLPTVAKTTRTQVCDTEGSGGTCGVSTLHGDITLTRFRYIFSIVHVAVVGITDTDAIVMLHCTWRSYFQIYL